MLWELIEVPVMSIHNMFSWRNEKNINAFLVKKMLIWSSVGRKYPVTIPSKLEPVFLDQLICISPDKTFLFSQKVQIFFLFLHKNVCFGYLLEASHYRIHPNYCTLRLSFQNY